MGSLIVMLKNVIVFVLLAVPGLILVKTKLLKAEQSGVLSKVLLYVGVPFLVFSSTMNISFNGEIIKWICITAILGVAFTFLTFFLSKPVTLMEKQEKTRGMMRFSAIFSNNGFLGIPLTIAVFGANSHVLTYVIILNTLCNVGMYTLGVYLISGDKNTIQVKKAVFNPVLIAFALGLIANFVSLKDVLPEVSTYSTYLSNIVTPLSMTILGMKLGAVKFTSLFTSWKMYYVSFLKLIILPIFVSVFMILLKWWFAFPDETILAFFVAFAMPTAGLSSVFADNHNGDTDSAVSYTLGSTVLSVATIPVLYGLLCAIL